MTRVFRRSAKVACGAVAAFAAGTAAILTPPKESLPGVLLPTRVVFEGVGRVGRCATAGACILADYQLNLRGDDVRDSQEAWNEVHTRCAHRLVRLAELNGGLYVKAGQIFANMTHILPHEYCSVMAVLQDQVITRPYSEIVAVLETDLKRPVSDVFSFIDPKPIAAASLAQVHRGTLRKENADVAVKVQYIDIAQRFYGDMRTIDLMLKVAGLCYSGFDFGTIVTKLNDTVAAELDFRLEADNSERAAKDLIAGGFGTRVVCAEMYREYVTKRILVSKYVQNGVKISDRAGIKRLGLNVAEVATNFFDAIAYQIFITGFFHGDPHAGNVLVTKLPNGKPQVVLLDFGLCATLTPEMRREMSDIWTSSVTHDSAKLAVLAKRYNCDDYELFASCFLQHPYKYFTAQQGPLLQKSVVESMRDTIRHKMNEVNNIVSTFPKEYALVLRSIMATKAINSELCDPVNRPLRMLHYSLQRSHEDAPWWRLAVMRLEAWAAEKWSEAVLAFAKWRDPQLAAMLEGTLHING